MATFQDAIQLYADSAGSSLLSFGCVFKNHWAHGKWSDTSIFTQGIFPNIALLELYMIVIALELWAPQLQGKHIVWRLDSSVTVGWLTKKQSPIPAVMQLICHLTLTCLQFQILTKAVHLKGALNQKKQLDQQGVPPFAASPLPIHGQRTNTTTTVSLATIMQQGEDVKFRTSTETGQKQPAVAVKTEVLKHVSLIILKALHVKSPQHIMHFNLAKKLQALVNFNLACHYGHLSVQCTLQEL